MMVLQLRHWTKTLFTEYKHAKASPRAECWLGSICSFSDEGEIQLKLREIHIETYTDTSTCFIRDGFQCGQISNKKDKSFLMWLRVTGINVRYLSIISLYFSFHPLPVCQNKTKTTVTNHKAKPNQMGTKKSRLAILFPENNQINVSIKIKGFG